LGFIPFEIRGFFPNIDVEIEPDDAFLEEVALLAVFEQPTKVTNKLI
jgi:hypothetical protein